MEHILEELIIGDLESHVHPISFLLEVSLTSPEQGRVFSRMNLKCS
jgi:hypothetical protein